MELEREMLREREEEPQEYERWVYVNRDDEKAHMAKLPRVIHCADVPGVASPKGTSADKKGGPSRKGRAVFIPWRRGKWEEMHFPIYTMEAHGHAGKPVGPDYKVGASGCHRHWMEACFIRPSGAYIEEQDGVHYECQGEGVLCVPTYSIHGHFFKEPPTKFGLTVISHIFEYLGLADMELFDIDETYQRRGKPLGDFHIIQEMQDIIYARRAVTRWDGGEPKTIYDRYLKDIPDENRWRMQAQRWIPADTVPWENTCQGKIRYIVHPWSKSVLRTLDCFQQEIPPGGYTGKHRHLYEELHWIDSGEGYIIQNGVRYNWKAGDLVCIPIGVTHQEFNTSDQPVKIWGVHPRVYMWIGYGGIEQFENASDYKP
ncbi:MAG: cupin domain-containing protein [Chloroflexi bacterium]|nr:cupin domain-containing protein [Chloroflexota bacterium]